MVPAQDFFFFNKFMVTHCGELTLGSQTFMVIILVLIAKEKCNKGLYCCFGGKITQA